MFMTLTVEHYQNYLTQEKGDWYRLAAQFYFCGYVNKDKTGFDDWMIMNWAAMVLGTFNKKVTWFERSPENLVVTPAHLLNTYILVRFRKFILLPGKTSLVKGTSMPEIQWIKISTGLFDDEKIKLIAKLPDADTIIMIWIYLLILAGKVNDGGLIYLGDHIAYNPEELATVIDRPVNTIRLALATFRKFKMVEELPDALLITNWEKHQNVEGIDKVRADTRLRVQNFRERKILLANTCNNKSEAVTLPNVTVTGQNRTEQNRTEENRTEQNRKSCC